MTTTTVFTPKRHALSLVLALALHLGTVPAVAHLMVAQHGTLNLVDNGAFMVLSLPISAFTELDKDGNGLVSMIEFNRARSSIIETVRNNVALYDTQGALILESIMLSPTEAPKAPNNLASQLTVMGKFVLNDRNSSLKFSITLFGSKPDEQTYKISANRAASDQFNELTISPEASSVSILEAGKQH